MAGGRELLVTTNHLFLSFDCNNVHSSLVVRHLQLRRPKLQCNSEGVEGERTDGGGWWRATTRASAKLVFQIIISRYCVLRRSLRGSKGGGGSDVAAAASSTWPGHAA